MALLTKVGSFNSGTGAAATTVAVTGVGFTPKAILFWLDGRTETVDTANAANHQRGFGVAVSTTSRHAISTQSQTAAGTTVNHADVRETACLVKLATAGTVDGAFDLASMDAGGFTLTVITQFTASVRIHYLAIGGATLTNVARGNFTESATTGNQSIAGLGFKPDALIVMHIATGGNPAAGTTSRCGIGFAAGATPTSAAWTGGSNTGVTTTATNAYAKSGDIIDMMAPATTTITSRATFTSFDTDGFSINWAAIGATNRTYFYLALKGGQYSVGSVLTQTDTTTKISANVGFNPSAALFLSACRAESAAGTPSAHDEWSIGAFDGARNARTHGTIDVNAHVGSLVATAVEHSAVYVNLSTAQALEGRMVLSSVDPQGFTLVMDDADPAQSFVPYLAMGPGTGAFFQEPFLPPDRATQRHLLTSGASRSSALRVSGALEVLPPLSPNRLIVDTLTSQPWTLLRRSASSADALPLVGSRGVFDGVDAKRGASRIRVETGEPSWPIVQHIAAFDPVIATTLPSPKRTPVAAEGTPPIFRAIAAFDPIIAKTLQAPRLVPLQADGTPPIDVPKGGFDDVVVQTSPAPIRAPAHVEAIPASALPDSGFDETVTRTIAAPKRRLPELASADVTPPVLLAIGISEADTKIWSPPREDPVYFEVTPPFAIPDVGFDAVITPSLPATRRTPASEDGTPPVVPRVAGYDPLIVATRPAPVLQPWIAPGTPPIVSQVAAFDPIIAPTLPAPKRVPVQPDALPSVVINTNPILALAGLHFYVDTKIAAPTHSGSDVTSWADISVLHNDLDVVTANKPQLLADGGVQFVAANQTALVHQGANSIGTGAYAIGILLKANQVIDGEVFLSDSDGEAANGVSIACTGTSWTDAHAGVVFAAIDGPIDTSNFHILIFDRAANSAPVMYLDNVAVTLAVSDATDPIASGTGPNSGIALGQLGNFTGRFHSSFTAYSAFIVGGANIGATNAHAIYNFWYSEYFSRPLVDRGIAAIPPRQPARGFPGVAEGVPPILHQLGGVDPVVVATWPAPRRVPTLEAGTPPILVPYSGFDPLVVLTLLPQLRTPASVDGLPPISLHGAGSETFIVQTCQAALRTPSSVDGTPPINVPYSGFDSAVDQTLRALPLVSSSAEGTPPITLHIAGFDLAIATPPLPARQAIAPDTFPGIPLAWIDASLFSQAQAQTSPAQRFVGSTTDAAPLLGSPVGFDQEIQDRRAWTSIPSPTSFEAFPGAAATWTPDVEPDRRGATWPRVNASETFGDLTSLLVAFVPTEGTSTLPQWQFHVARSIATDDSPTLIPLEIFAYAYEEGFHRHPFVMRWPRSHETFGFVGLRLFLADPPLTVKQVCSGELTVRQLGTGEFTIIQLGSGELVVRQLDTGELGVEQVLSGGSLTIKQVR